MKSPGPYSSSSPGPQQPNLTASSLHLSAPPFSRVGESSARRHARLGWLLWTKSQNHSQLAALFHRPPPNCKMRFPRTGLWCPLFFTLFTSRLPCDSDSKESACSVGDPGSIPGLGRSPGEGNGTPLQYPGLENPTGEGAQWATVHGVTKSRTWLGN